MNDVDEVTSLFDSKASSWESKYCPEGPLAHRVEVFASLLAGQVSAEASILDFGCGTGAIASSLSQHGFKMTACDVSKQMIAHGKRLHRDQTISWCLLLPGCSQFPFADETFDAIIASSVFEYLDEVDNALRECRRVLRAGGKLIISVPNLEHLSRRFERTARPLARLGSKIPFDRDLPKIGNYLAYLRVSRSRFSKDQWQQKAVGAALRPLGEELPKPESGRAGTMLYLVFER